MAALCPSPWTTRIRTASAAGCAGGADEKQEDRQAPQGAGGPEQGAQRGQGRQRQQDDLHGSPRLSENPQGLPFNLTAGPSERYC